MAGRSLNKVLLIGNVTRDPELRYTANGAAVTSFGLATNREYTPTNSSESVEQVEFHNVVAWAKLAELCSKLLGKGDKVFIEGRLQTREWSDEASGKKMYRTEIIANEMILLSSKKGPGTGEFAEGNDANVPAAEDTVDQTLEQNTASADEEIPF